MHCAACGAVNGLRLEGFDQRSVGHQGKEHLSASAVGQGTNDLVDKVQSS